MALKAGAKTHFLPPKPSPLTHQEKQELLSTLTSTELELQKKKLDLENESQTRRALQQEKKEWRDRQEKRPFVAVVVDADADDYVSDTHEKATIPFQFGEDLLTRGEKGGAEAADALLSAVQGYAQNKIRELPEVDIVVRAFANVTGLREALHRRRVTCDMDQLRAFASGFNNRQALFDFVDVGSGKERADSKIRGLKTEQFDGVFKGLSATTMSPNVSRTAWVTPKVWGPASYPTESEDSSEVKPHVSKTQPGLVNPAAHSSRLGPIIRDENGRRVDKKLHVDQDVVDRIKKGHLCYSFYLRGACWPGFIGVDLSGSSDMVPVAADSSSTTANYSLLFRQASGLEERERDPDPGTHEQKLARAMSIAADDLVPTKQLSDYGVDSLMAVELRNWIARDFGASVPVFDFMGGATIADIGALVAEKTEFGS
ncbi:hypothetical protein PG984_014104 [Apiospora sp. TS-2023a]